MSFVNVLKHIHVVAVEIVKLAPKGLYLVRKLLQCLYHELDTIVRKVRVCLRIDLLGSKDEDWCYLLKPQQLHDQGGVVEETKVSVE